MVGQGRQFTQGFYYQTQREVEVLYELEWMIGVILGIV